MDWELSVKDFDVLAKIGSGSFGVVYKVQAKSDRVFNKFICSIIPGEICVMKQIDTNKMSVSDWKEAQKETLIHKTLKNEYIV